MNEYLNFWRVIKASGT